MPQQHPVIFLVMRRMRFPLLVLVVVYAVCVIGMTLVPGIEIDGKVTYMDFFHAFYFISYTATTIGFGEIPHEFSGAQRLWAAISMYLTVIGWLYAIGTILGLVQDEALQREFKQSSFARSVSNINEPFYLICGYGDTGEALVQALDEHPIRIVVVEIRQPRIDELKLANYPVYIPHLCDDASKPSLLQFAGLQNPHCAGVVAITNDNFSNLRIAITTKLLNPNLPAICRVDSQDVGANMASFGTDLIYNPFEIFAAQLQMILHAPSLYRLLEWLIGRQSQPQNDDFDPPEEGVWIICGYGRFGKAIYEQLGREQRIQCVIIDIEAEAIGSLVSPYIIGRGTEAHTLRQAQITEAVGLVAGTDDDVDNLSIVMTAREMNPDLFVVIRQNHSDNQLIFDAVHADIVMQPSQIIASHIQILLGLPLLNQFVNLARNRGDDCDNWSQQQIERMQGLEILDPHVWEVSITPTETPAIYDFFSCNRDVTLAHILRDPRDWKEQLACVPLLLLRGDESFLLPEPRTVLQDGDRVLCCGKHGHTASLLNWCLNDPFVLEYVMTGRNIPRSYVWRKIFSRYQRMSLSRHVGG